MGEYTRIITEGKMYAPGEHPLGCEWDLAVTGWTGKPNTIHYLTRRDLAIIGRKLTDERIVIGGRSLRSIAEIDQATDGRFYTSDAWLLVVWFKTQAHLNQMCRMIEWRVLRTAHIWNLVQLDDACQPTFRCLGKYLRGRWVKTPVK